MLGHGFLFLPDLVLVNCASYFLFCIELFRFGWLLIKRQINPEVMLSSSTCTLGI